MKKIFLSLVLVSFLSIFLLSLPVRIQAQGVPSAVVAGVTLNSSFVVLPGVSVTIYCLHNGAYEIHNAVSGTGVPPYTGYFDSWFYNGCAAGDHVWVTANQGNLNAMVDADVLPHGQFGLAIIQLFLSDQPAQTPPEINPPPAVPEFGLITGTVALAASFLSFRLLRSRS